MAQKSTIVLIGPAYPFRGGISQTQSQFAQSLSAKGNKVYIWTFTHLYPKILFSGSSQFDFNQPKGDMKVYRIIHSYNFLNWKKVARSLNKIRPDVIVFRYYSPLLAPCYGSILKSLEPGILKIALVDNWIGHEKRIFDSLLNRYFSKHIHKFTTLSENVAEQIANKVNSKPIWFQNHPIASDLPKRVDKNFARNQLGWNINARIVLFYGIIRKYKGLDLLLKAFGEEPLYSDCIELKVAGDCYQNESHYRKILTKYRLQKRVNLNFNYADDQLTQLLFSASDLLVLPYRSSTQSGVISLAYHYSLPLVVSNAKGLSQIVNKDGSGFTSNNFPIDLGNTIQRALKSNNINRFKRNILNVKKEYSWDTYAENWLEFINNPL